MANENNKENLKIVNFAGVKQLDIDFANLTLLLGPQAVGKSIVLKLVYFFRRLRANILDFCTNIIMEPYKSDKDEFELETGSFKINLSEKLPKDLGQRFLNIFPLACYRESCTEETSIYYCCFHAGNLQEWTVSINCENGVVLLNEKHGMLEKIEQCFAKAKEQYIGNSLSLDGNFTFNSNEENPKLFFEKELNTLFSGELNVFIPSGRSFFATVDKNIWYNVSNQKIFSLDPIFIDFGQLYSVFKNLYTSRELSSDFIKNTLRGTYIKKGDHEYIQHQDGRRVALHLASSGQQELIPLAIILEVFSHFESSSVNIYIEESEAHLFPEAQKEISYEIAKLLNHLMEKQGARIFLSSHSPYIMTSFNNLLQAGKIIAENPEKSDRVEEIVPQGTVLKPNVTAAYFLGKALESMNIMTENGLINAEAIDSVSYTIIEDYDKLMELKVKK